MGIQQDIKNSSLLQERTFTKICKCKDISLWSAEIGLDGDTPTQQESVFKGIPKLKHNFLP